MSGKQNELQFYPLQKVRCIYFANYVYSEANEMLAKLKKTNDTVELIKRLNGVKVNADNLKKFFDSFESQSGVKYDVQVHENLNKDQTDEELDKEVKIVKEGDYDAVMVFIAGHGKLKEGSLVFDTDEGNYFETDKIFGAFSASKCPEMHGKPKLFFIDTCQGPDADSGELASSAKGPLFSSLKKEYIRLPTNSDFLIARSNTFGLKCVDNSCAGSWFFSALHEVLQKQATKLDLLAMLTIVQYKVALKEVYPILDADKKVILLESANVPGSLEKKREESKDKMYIKQMPNIYSTLRMSVKLTKNLKQTDGLK